ncbi:MAG: hypothetical protein ABSF35_00240 [Polyangia bacterium]|jgi:hypothetical protein
MSKLRLSTTSLLVTGLFLACSGSSCTGNSGPPATDALPASNDSGSTGGGIAFDALPAKYAAAICTAYQNCLGPLFSLFFGGTDCVDLTTQRLENGTFALMPQKITAGTIRYDGTKAQACLDAISSLTCDGLLTRDQPACLAALDGLVPLGGNCDLNEECAGSALCQSSSGTCPGTCVPLLSAGQACSADGDCADGLQCSSETSLCVKPATAGDSCDYGSPPCGPGLLCLGEDDTNKISGTCRNAVDALSAAAGATCDPVAGTLCAPGVSCVADHVDLISQKLVWTCVTTGTYPAGGACKPGFPEACATGTYCLTGTGIAALSGTCTAIPAAKQPCGTGVGAQCQPGAVCVASLCQNYAANGVSCTGDAMCYSGYCGPTGGCQPRLPCTSSH